MKLTKGKISRLLKKKNQSLKRLKKRLAEKENKTFRKNRNNKYLDLKNRTLKHYDLRGGAEDDPSVPVMDPSVPSIPIPSVDPMVDETNPSVDPMNPMDPSVAPMSPDPVPSVDPMDPSVAPVPSVVAPMDPPSIDAPMSPSDVLSQSENNNNNNNIVPDQFYQAPQEGMETEGSIGPTGEEKGVGQEEQGIAQEEALQEPGLEAQEPASSGLGPAFETYKQEIIDAVVRGVLLAMNTPENPSKSMNTAVTKFSPQAVADVSIPGEEVEPEEQLEEVEPEEQLEEVVPEQQLEEVVPEQQLEEVVPEQLEEVVPDATTTGPELEGQVRGEEEVVPDVTIPEEQIK